MSNLANIYKFNKFPIHKDKFFSFLDALFDFNNDFSSLFYLEPRMYDRVYVTMSDKELLSIAKRFDVTEIIKEFERIDAVFDNENRYILLHVPAMVRNTSHIPTNPGDKGRRSLFAVHFFACLFHELTHANDFARIIMNERSRLLFNPKKPSVAATLTEKQLEETADHGEEKYLKMLSEFLAKKDIGWNGLSEWLFDWDKLQKYVLKS